MFPMWNETDKKNRADDRRDCGIWRRAWTPICCKNAENPPAKLVRAVADAREKVREAMRPKESMAR